MIKDLSQSLIKAVADINSKSREAFVAEQRALQEKMQAKAMKMPKQPEPKADPAAHSGASDMAKKNMKAEAAEGSMPRNEKEKKLAKLHGDPNKITHGDVLKGRGVRREAWEDMLKAAQARRENEKKNAGTGKFDVKKTSTGTAYTRKASTFDDGGKDADMKKADKKMKKEEVEQIDELSVETMKSAKEKLSGLAHNARMDDNKHLAYQYAARADKIRKAYRWKEITTANRARREAQAAQAKNEEVEQSVQENKDTPGNSTHQCAIHVKSEQYGKGRTLTSQHAEPDETGFIAWYDVMFDEGIKRVATEDIEVLVSESHMNHKKKKM